MMRKTLVDHTIQSMGPAEHSKTVKIYVTEGWNVLLSQICRNYPEAVIYKTCLDSQKVHKF